MARLARFSWLAVTLGAVLGAGCIPLLRQGGGPAAPITCTAAPMDSAAVEVREGHTGKLRLEVLRHRLRIPAGAFPAGTTVSMWSPAGSTYAEVMVVARDAQGNQLQPLRPLGLQLRRKGDGLQRQCVRPGPLALYAVPGEGPGVPVLGERVPGSQEKIYATDNWVEAPLPHLSRYMIGTN